MTTETFGDVYLDRREDGRRQWQVVADPHVMVRLKRIFPRASVHRSGELRLSDSPEVARDLEWILERWPMQLSTKGQKHLAKRASRYRETQAAVRSIMDGHVPPIDVTQLGKTPRDYQVQAASIVRHTGRLLLCDELGLGKTFTSLLVLQDPAALPALVVTLHHLPAQWLDELHACLPWLHGHIVRTSQPYDPAQRRGSNGMPPDVLIMNYHKLAGWQHHLAGKVRTVIFDEAQELRRAGSLKYNAAAQIADGATFRMGLTATPIYNYGGEIHNVLSVLDRDALGDRDEFSREWCTGAGDKLAVKDPAALGAHLRGEGLMIRRTRKEVRRELPAVSRVPHAIELDEATFETEAAGAIDLATKILAKQGTNTELFQAAGEFDWRLRHATGLAKANYVAEFVRMLLETEEPLVLFGWHRDVYTRWDRLLHDHEPRFFTGEESAHQKRDAQLAFMNGDTNLLIMSLRAGAGLDGLQERAHVAVFGELDWSPGVHEQCIGRLHRDGQEDPVVAYFLVAQSGSDPAIAEVLSLKKHQAEGIVEPEREPLERAGDTTDRVKLLAREFLTRKGLTIPEDEAAA